MKAFSLAMAIAIPTGLALLAAGNARAQSMSAPHPHTVASPGTEASLRRYINSLELGKPNYEEMAPRLAQTVRDELPQILNIIQRVGAFQSMAFEGVDDQGLDVYRVTFEHGQIEWRIAPLSPDGKAETRGFHEIP